MVTGRKACQQSEKKSTETIGVVVPRLNGYSWPCNSWHEEINQRMLIISQRINVGRDRLVSAF